MNELSIAPSGSVSADGGPAAVRGRRRHRRRPLPDSAARPGLGVAAGGLAARRAPLASRSRPGRERIVIYSITWRLRCFIAKERLLACLQKSQTNGRRGSSSGAILFPDDAWLELGNFQCTSPAANMSNNLNYVHPLTVCPHKVIEVRKY